MAEPRAGGEAAAAAAATPRPGFFASTGRTATMFLATCLDRLEDVRGLHEGHVPGDPPTPRLPLINLQNRRAWHDPAYAAQVVAEARGAEALTAAADGARVLVDAAFYNAPLLGALAARHPEARLFVIFRRCEDFVRSATILRGEDRQPAGWPCRSKPLTDRERFIALGRLRPRREDPEGEAWDGWSAIQRNVWLWSRVNRRLHAVAAETPGCTRLLFEDLARSPEAFWRAIL